MKIRGSYETEIDVTQAGYVKIEQADQLGNEPDVILLTAEQLPAVISELQALLADRESWDHDEREMGSDTERNLQQPTQAS